MHTFSLLKRGVSSIATRLPYVSLSISAVCCIAACLADLLPRLLVWWTRAHALYLGDTVWPLGSTVRRSLSVVGKPDLAASLAGHAVSHPLTMHKAACYHTLEVLPGDSGLLVSLSSHA